MTNQYKQLFLKILERYRLDKASPDEISFLEKYYNLYEDKDETELTDKEYLSIKNTIKAKVDLEIALLSNNSPTTKLWPSWAKYSSVAAILIVVSAFIIIFRNYNLNHANTVAAQNDIQPGGQHAFLTLANGKKIMLDTAGNGQIANQHGITVTKTEKGQLIYLVSDQGDTDQAPTNNTISTPKGGNYQIILPDGTNVTLNAASSLTFPTIFKGSERSVSLDGEAYFEVSKNAEMPFKVKSGQQIVEVLGTHFDVNAYADEPDIKTTLLEGSVKVSTGQATVLIKPGQQSVIDKSNQRKVIVRDADLEKELAWKNGVFSFENDDLKSIMRQIARWYDAEVIYEGEFPNDEFIGGISRNSKLSAVAKILKLNNILLKIDGKTIRVSYQNPAP